MTFKLYNELQIGKFKVIMSPEDCERLYNYGWFIKRCGAQRQKLYACRNTHYKDDKGKWHCVTVYMHRDVLEAPPGFQVHHINGNTLDNRRSNLCLLTKEEHDKRHGVFA